MTIDVLTIFPGMFDAVLGESIIKRAQKKKKINIRIHDLRDHTKDRHRKVDDRPFGGGPGMVLKIEPIYKAVKRILKRKSMAKKKVKVVLLTPQGKKFNQKTAGRMARLDGLILICGHYEGIDERVRKVLLDDEISIGDYILTCGELPSMVLIDAVVRLIPGVLGNERSRLTESFENNLLEYPQYTRPASFCGIEVPKVLMSGNHKQIEKWRIAETLKRTRKRRPDLLNTQKQTG
ncbi:MAG: tRNA (guanosine(37)-N1)-methyltransferase TrmD [Candidatus Omnitrophota bacterium]|nr:tRNA (guanosine(37)-N1)-methyltransferase TrmD [Candidatus Omnitrophota bacterium]